MWNAKMKICKILHSHSIEFNSLRLLPHTAYTHFAAFWTIMTATTTTSTLPTSMTIMMMIFARLSTENISYTVWIVERIFAVDFGVPAAQWFYEIFMTLDLRNVSSDLSETFSLKMRLSLDKLINSSRPTKECEETDRCPHFDIVQCSILV